MYIFRNIYLTNNDQQFKCINVNQMCKQKVNTNTWGNTFVNDKIIENIDKYNRGEWCCHCTFKTPLALVCIFCVGPGWQCLPGPRLTDLRVCGMNGRAAPASALICICFCLTACDTEQWLHSVLQPLSEGNNE